MLEPFKYAGYPLLLQAVTLPEPEDVKGAQAGQAGAQSGQAHWLARENVPQLQVDIKVLQ